MRATRGSTDERHAPERYEIRVKGHIDDRWADWFEGLSFSFEGDGTTLLSGAVVDQAALHGLLRKVRDLGMPLISVIRVKPTHAMPDETPNTEHNRLKEETNT